MKKENVQLFVVQNQSNFDATQLPIITQQLERMDDSQLMVVSGAGYKNPIISLILSLFLGYLGVDRFFVGDIGMGVGKLLTFGGFGIWSIIDWFLIMKRTREKNYDKFMQIASITPQSYQDPQYQDPQYQAPQQPQYQPPQYQPPQQPYQGDNQNQ